MSSRVQRVWGAAIVVAMCVAFVALAGCSKAPDNTTTNNTTNNTTGTTTDAGTGTMASGSGGAMTAPAGGTDAAAVKCAVCGQTGGTPMTVAYEGKDFTVCSQACKDAFEKEPAKWAAAASGGSTN